MCTASKEPPGFWGQIAREAGQTMRAAPTSWPYTARLCLIIMAAATVIVLLSL